LTTKCYVNVRERIIMNAFLKRIFTAIVIALLLSCIYGCTAMNRAQARWNDRQHMLNSDPSYVRQVELEKRRHWQALELQAYQAKYQNKRDERHYDSHQKNTYQSSPLSSLTVRHYDEYKMPIGSSKVTPGLEYHPLTRAKK